MIVGVFGFTMDSTLRPSVPNSFKTSFESRASFTGYALSCAVAARAFFVPSNLPLELLAASVLMAQLAALVMSGLGRELKGYLREDAWVDLGKTR